MIALLLPKYRPILESARDRAPSQKWIGGNHGSWPSPSPSSEISQCLPEFPAHSPQPPIHRPFIWFAPHLDSNIIISSFKCWTFSYSIIDQFLTHFTEFLIKSTNYRPFLWAPFDRAPMVTFNIEPISNPFHWISNQIDQLSSISLSTLWSCPHGHIQYWVPSPKS